MFKTLEKLYLSSIQAKINTLFYGYAEASYKTHTWAYARNFYIGS